MIQTYVCSNRHSWWGKEPAGPGAIIECPFCGDELVFLPGKPLSAEESREIMSKVEATMRREEAGGEQ